MSFSLAEIRSAFKLLDPSGRGYITEDNARVLFVSIVGCRDLSEDELCALTKSMDIECNGKIAATEFERLVSRRLAERSLAEESWITFQLLAKEGTTVSMDEVCRFMEGAACFPPAHLELLKAHFGAQGVMNYEGWKRLVCSSSCSP